MVTFITTNTIAILDFSQAIFINHSMPQLLMWETMVCKHKLICLPILLILVQTQIHVYNKLHVPPCSDRNAKGKGFWSCIISLATIDIGTFQLPQRYQLLHTLAKIWLITIEHVRYTIIHGLLEVTKQPSTLEYYLSVLYKWLLSSHTGHQNYELTILYLYLIWWLIIKFYPWLI